MSWNDWDGRAFDMEIPLVPEGVSGKMQVIQRKPPVLYPWNFADIKESELDHYRGVEYFGKNKQWNQTFNVLQEMNELGGLGGRKELWMSGTPREVRPLLPLIDRLPEGSRLFMSGLGLGILPRIASYKLEDVVVVERSEDVYNLVWPTVQAECEGWVCIVADLGEYLEQASLDPIFDLVYLDTWPAGDYLYLPWMEYVRAKAKKLVILGGKLEMWAYKTALLNLRRDLRVQADMAGILKSQPEKHQGYKRQWPYFWPFVEWLMGGQHSKAQVKERINLEVAAFKVGDREGLQHRT